MQKRVLIVGAGIAGPTLACALVQKGIRPDVVELKPNWNILGAGMYVQNNALRGFSEIGIAEEIMAAGWKSPTGTSVIADRNGEMLARTTVPECPGSDFPGYVPIARPALHDILEAATKRAGIAVRMGTTIEALVQNSDSVRVSFSDGTTGEYDLVVGADGINSRVREAIFPGVDPVYSGFSNWRVMLPMKQPRREVMWQIAPEKSFGIIPVSDSQLYVAGVSKEPGNPRYELNDLLPLMQARFSEFGGPAGELMAMVTDPRQIVYTPIHEISMPLPWSKGRVVLLGDAAHASTPFWAQGASMAVEDAVVLARLLAERDDVPALLAEWERRRYPRCAFVQEGSKATGVRGHAPGEEAFKRSLEHVRAHAQDDVDARYARLNEPI